MSVIIALISNRAGIVTSDGRIFGPALLDGGKVTRLASIESESFDKTFSLDRGKVIGALSGLIRFSGKTLSEHVSDVAAPLLCRSGDLQALTNEIEKEVSQRLAHIDTHEVIFSCRKLDLLLVAGMSLGKADMRIVSIRFYPKDNVIASESECVAAYQKVQYYARGEDKAVAAARGILAKNHAPNSDTAFLKKLATQTIRVAIKTSGTHEHGSALACGGQIFCKSTFHK